MSKEIRKHIDTFKERLLKENYNNFNTSETDVKKIFDYIQSQPIKHKLNTKYGESFKLYENGIDTALNCSIITHFYLKYLRNNKKSTIILPTPSLDNKLYDKLNNLIMLCDVYSVEEDKPYKPKSLMSMSDNDIISLHNRLLRANCFQMMDILLYEDYFNVDFRYGNGHNIISELILPRNENEFYELFNIWNDKNGQLRHILFYADVIPIVYTIEKY